jgi:dephospho-CoA kinase
VLKVGLTGGIGAGKSTVARRLAAHGATVVDADQLARAVVEPGTEGLAEVAGAFGPSVLTVDGRLDRAAMAALVFADPAARRRLEAIVHPRLAAATAATIATLPADTVVVHDMPLLVEKSMGAEYHLVVVVAAATDVRVARLAGRGIGAADARTRIAAQAGDEDRRRAADVWLDNNGDQDDAAAAVDRLWTRRIVPFHDNLKAVRCAVAPQAVPRGEPADPAVRRRLLERAERACGRPSTARWDDTGTLVLPLATPGEADLAAGLEAEVGALRRALLDAGFPPSGIDVPDGWLHGNADPGAPARVQLVRVPLVGMPLVGMPSVGVPWVRG